MTSRSHTLFAWLLAGMSLWPAGCITLDLESARTVASIASWGTTSPITVRKTPRNPLADQLNLLGWGGPQPSPRTRQLLRRFALEKKYDRSPEEALIQLRESIDAEPSLEKLAALSELAFVQANKVDRKANEQAATDLYGASIAFAYQYLFDPRFQRERNPYDPVFREVCELYNSSLEGLLRMMQKKGVLRPGAVHSVDSCGHHVEFSIALNGPWHEEDFDRFEFVSDYEVNGLSNQYHTYGLGVPLIAIRKRHEGESATEKYYPEGLSFAVTAFFRVLPSQQLVGPGQRPTYHAVLELHDPLTRVEIDIAGKRTPLESDISTPLAYYLNDPLLTTNTLATFALLDADFAKDFRGLYMLEPYDPNKIPVVMVHGLWSSPVTWMEMFNDLRAMKALRDHYQFWFYLYPTGQPFWISAKQMRADLAEARQALDPQRRAESLNQMVLVGHSMGGLVSRLQTIDSGDDFWSVVSDRSFTELHADEEVRQELQTTLFFQPNPSVRRVVTLATPHRGSNFANSLTRWLSRNLIRLPERLTHVSNSLKRDNPGLFRDTDLLTITTSIDSLAPDSPILPVMLQARKAPWVRYHNVIGRASDETLLGKLGVKVSGAGDGVVPIESASVDDVDSHLEVVADHTTIHQHPECILEVRRILLKHLVQAQSEMQWDPNLMPAGLQQASGQPVPISSSHPAPQVRMTDRPVHPPSIQHDVVR